MADQTNTPPITYPRAMVGGKQYELKFGMGSLFLLNSWGVDVEKMNSAVERWIADKRNVEMVMTLAAAALGSHVDGTWQTAGFTPLKLADAMVDGEFAKLGEATMAALGKASPAEETATQPAKTPTPISKVD